MVYDSQKDSMATINQRYLMHGARDGQRPTSGFAFYKAWQMSCGPSEILLPWYEVAPRHVRNDPGRTKQKEQGLSD
ncbi:hypothetical protein SNOG_03687 [Parastagonospora nodorum SN15]|uniref:Uncharacterized protein n=1 Tax=Phaeosphaeria nodorum (strain SN15 / ATCC MYA-4574 / FGSC 10173) TaxID=321614 RepID=Q0UX27_PHANO|nr:hypothetical protein SNOG_03687 [Parastagonospora nodorum SN15]EAT88892.1 hypothetical protein SNOG_03687 [Parastagonospora nodorum SN15]